MPRSIACVLFLLASAAASAQVVYTASQFSGTTVDVKVNACIKAAIAGGQSATCDARSVTGTVAAEIDVGDHAQQSVTLLLPKGGAWIVTINDGIGCAIKQYSNTAIMGTNTGNPYGAGGASQFAIVTESGLGRGPGALYCNEPAAAAIGGGSYIRISGVAFFNSGLAPMGLGADFVEDGWYDNSDLDHVLVFDGHGTQYIERGSCCSASHRNLTLDGLQTANGPGLVFENTHTQYNEGVVFDNLSVTHPGKGFPNIACTNTGTFAWWDSITIRGLYTEGNTTDTTTAHFQCDSVYSLDIEGWRDARLNPQSTAYAMQLSHTGATYVKTQFTLNDFTWAPSGTSTNTINDQINNIKIPSKNLGVSSGAGGISHYSTY